jgi:hypothetical protein
MKKAMLMAVGVLASLVFSACNPLDSKLKAGLQVITTDVPSSLFLNDQYLDKTPFIGKDLKPGQYKLRIQPEDPTLVPHETSISLKKGLLTVVTWKPGQLVETSGGVTYEMEPLQDRSATELSFVTVPDNAIIKIDNQENIFSPVVETGIAAGQHEFEVSLPSYESQKHTINVVAGYRITITVKLAKNVTTDGTPILNSTATPNATPNPATSAAQPRLTPTPTPAPVITGPSVTIKPTNYLVNGKQVLRVRDTSNSSGKELGFANVGDSYSYLGVTQNGWYKISFNGAEGWVNATYATLKP